ncbi:hypothetical protein [Reichenbachiella sp. MSK19-1]|uniref:hypothetical protein n=1 Tax=Reichenbachiella sp. MSK19-1 TaxID=1897631 RepID=UPI000E6B8839|nr:hypothetical protein [Reichenbachiella sp. MSK19-1]RJE74679.1 hypothetical protein BGP76_16215 [Reichenbachiella sp. MSK19-1]
MLEEFGELPEDLSYSIIQSYKLLNKLRNEFAHKLHFNESIFRDLLLSVKRIDPTLLNEKEIENEGDVLKYFENISFILSYLNGYIFGLYQRRRDFPSQQ